jgi:phosphatidylinositol transfer protein SFH5
MVTVEVMTFEPRNSNPTEAREMLVNTLRWRQSFDIDGVMKEEFDQAIFGNLAKIYGKDKEDRPVTYNIYGGNKDTRIVFGDVQRFVR